MGLEILSLGNFLGCTVSSLNLSFLCIRIKIYIVFLKENMHKIVHKNQNEMNYEIFFQPEKTKIFLIMILHNRT